MLPTPSLVEMTLKEAIDAVAARAAERRGRAATYAEKVALELSNALSAAGDFLNKNDAAKGALIGGGIGALGGAGSALMGPGSVKDKAKRAGRSLLGGGIAGAAVGGGLGLAKQNLGGLKPPTAGPSGEAGTAGTFTAPGGGQMKIDPKILKSRPELAEQVQRLSTPSVETRIGEGIGAAAGGAFNYAPITGTAGLAVGGNEVRRALGGNSLYNTDNLKAALREKDIGKLLGDSARGDVMGNLGEAQKAKLVGQARGGFMGRLKSLVGRGPDPDEVLHSQPVEVPAPKGPKGAPPAAPTTRDVTVTRANVTDALRSGRNANRILGGKIPPVAGRNAAILGLAGVADLGRHAYLGHRDDVESRKQLRELMSQVAKETANRGA